MTLLSILQIAACVGTVVTGAVCLIAPRSITGFIGLEPQGGRGLTELRAVLGGGFIALGIVPLVLDDPAAFTMLGIGYLAIGLARAVSMVIDKSTVRSNLVSLAVEIVFGLVLVL